MGGLLIWLVILSPVLELADAAKPKAFEEESAIYYCKLAVFTVSTVLLLFVGVVSIFEYRDDCFLERHWPGWRKTRIFTYSERFSEAMADFNRTQIQNGFPERVRPLNLSSEAIWTETNSRFYEDFITNRGKLGEIRQGVFNNDKKVGKVPPKAEETSKGKKIPAAVLKTAGRARPVQEPAPRSRSQ